MSEERPPYPRIPDPERLRLCDDEIARMAKRITELEETVDEYRTFVHTALLGKPFIPRP